MRYFDYAATTPVRPEVQQSMEEYFTRDFANPHSPHELGLQVKTAVEEARTRIAKVLGAAPSQIIFTSGATEGNNLAILGGSRAGREKGCHIITSPIEHNSVLVPVKALQDEGFSYSLAPVDSTGLIDPKSVEQLVRPETVMVSLGFANNEIGTVQPIQDIAQNLKDQGILFHVDAVQAFGKLPVRVDTLGVSLLTLSAHKIYGPKGVGILYVGTGVRLKPIIYGGSQERGLRPGSLNVPAIMGFATAVELAASEQDAEQSRLRTLSEELLQRALLIKGVYQNGNPEFRLPGHVNLGVKGIEGQVITAELNKRGIFLSPGAACSSGSTEPSHVLIALGQGRDKAYEGFRITLGRETNLEDVLYLAANLSMVIEELARKFNIGTFE